MGSNTGARTSASPLKNPLSGLLVRPGPTHNASRSPSPSPPGPSGPAAAAVRPWDNRRGRRPGGCQCQTGWPPRGTSNLNLTSAGWSRADSATRTGRAGTGLLLRFLKKNCFGRGFGAGTVPRARGFPPAYGAETGPKSPGTARRVPRRSGG